MADIVIRGIDNTHPDPVKDQRGCYKRGMVIEVFEDNFDLGDMVVPPDYLVIKYPGASVEKLKKYEKHHETSEIIIEENLEPRIKRNIHRRREWRFEIENLPNDVLTKLNETGSITIGPHGDIPWGQFKHLVFNYKTGLKETEDI